MAAWRSGPGSISVKSPAVIRTPLPDRRCCKPEQRRRSFSAFASHEPCEYCKSDGHKDKSDDEHMCLHLALRSGSHRQPERLEGLVSYPRWEPPIVRLGCNS